MYCKKNLETYAICVDGEDNNNYSWILEQSNLIDCEEETVVDIIYDDNVTIKTGMNVSDIFTCTRNEKEKRQKLNV